MKTRAGLRAWTVLTLWLSLTSAAFSAQTPGSLDESFELDEEPFASVTGVFVRNAGDILLTPEITTWRVAMDGSRLPFFSYTNEAGFGIPITAEFPPASGKIVFYPTPQGLVRFNSNGELDERFHSPLDPSHEGVSAIRVSPHNPQSFRDVVKGALTAASGERIPGSSRRVA